MARTARAVTVIPASINRMTHLPDTAALKRRVAGYARVSTDSDEQYTSYEAQVDYYTKYIGRHADWDFVKVYTDEGISGTNTRKREGFNEMITDALNGKIDLIVTKSVSRFARNTVDSLVTIRKLKEKGVEVFFEKENIYTFDGKGELLITIMSSMAQEESRSISENVTWGHRKRFADGKVSLPYKQFLGYEKGPDNIPQVVPEEAETVRYIFHLFMTGKTSYSIAKQLTDEGIPTPRGRKTWSSSTIESMLSNEKYKGAALLQKSFTVDFLQKKMKKNEGEVPQYYVEHSHEAIISPEEWQAVQNELARRKVLGKRYSGASILATRLICADCGAFFGAKVWHSNDQYRRVVLQCNDKFKHEKHCTTPKLNEDDVKRRFLEVFNSMILNKDDILDDCRFIQSRLADCSELDAQIADVTQELEVITELTQRCVNENSTTAQDQEAYFERYNGYVERFEAKKKRLDELHVVREKRMAKLDALGGFMFTLMERDDPMMEFDDILWLQAVDTVLVHPDGRLTFRFFNDAEIDG